MQFFVISYFLRQFVDLTEKSCFSSGKSLVALQGLLSDELDTEIPICSVIVLLSRVQFPYSHVILKDSPSSSFQSVFFLQLYLLIYLLSLLFFNVSDFGALKILDSCVCLVSFGFCFIDADSSFIFLKTFNCIKLLFRLLFSLGLSLGMNSPMGGNGPQAITLLVCYKVSF